MTYKFLSFHQEYVLEKGVEFSSRRLGSYLLSLKRFIPPPPFSQASKTHTNATPAENFPPVSYELSGIGQSNGAKWSDTLETKRGWPFSQSGPNEFFYYYFKYIWNVQRERNPFSILHIPSWGSWELERKKSPTETMWRSSHARR